MHITSTVVVGFVIVGLLVSASTAQECPTTNSGTFGACVEACSSDGDCTNGQLCCSNGCGRECMEPEIDPCATVRCAAPNCSEVSAGTITPEGQCCPVCACQTADGDMVAAGTSFMNDCNTCSCSSTGIAGCTRIACPPTTEPTATTNPVTPTTPPADCPIVGQQRLECASLCNVTCANRNTPVICPLVCIVNGCQCPSGTVIDEQTGRCVEPSDCPASACPVVGQSQVACASPCPITCANRNTPVICPTVCVTNGCQCPSGTVIDEQSNTCVEPSSCPVSDCPIVGQQRLECASACNVTCANRNTPVPCPDVCIVNGCQCPSGTVIDEQTGSCVEPSSCPASACPIVGQSRVECAPSCPITCATLNSPFICLRCATNGCKCPSGTVIDEQAGRCVEPSSCSTPGCMLTNGSWVGVGVTYKKDCNTCTCSGPEREVCTEIACNVGNPGGVDNGDGAGAMITVGLMTTILCGLLSVFF